MKSKVNGLIFMTICLIILIIKDLILFQFTFIQFFLHLIKTVNFHFY